jgi:hypothetical protein
MYERRSSTPKTKYRFQMNGFSDESVAMIRRNFTLERISFLNFR